MFQRRTTVYPTEDGQDRIVPLRHLYLTHITAQTPLLSLLFPWSSLLLTLRRLVLVLV